MCIDQELVMVVLLGLGMGLVDSRDLLINKKPPRCAEVFYLSIELIYMKSERS